MAAAVKLTVPLLQVVSSAGWVCGIGDPAPPSPTTKSPKLATPDTPVEFADVDDTVG